MEMGAIRDQAAEDARGYWETHQTEHLRGENLIKRARIDTDEFIAEASLNKGQTEAYLTQWVETYLSMEKIDKDMRLNPQDYE